MSRAVREIRWLLPAMVFGLLAMGVALAQRPRQVDDAALRGGGKSFDIPAASGNPQTHQEATPLVFNGVLYNIGPWSVVYALTCAPERNSGVRIRT